MYLLVHNCNEFKAYYSLNRLCKENGFKKIDKDLLPVMIGGYMILEIEVNNKI